MTQVRGTNDSSKQHVLLRFFADPKRATDPSYTSLRQEIFGPGPLPAQIELEPVGLSSLKTHQLLPFRKIAAIKSLVRLRA